jgi:hypothetical protein
LLHFHAHVVDKTGWICFSGEKEIKAVSCSRASCLVLLQALVSIPFRFPHFHCLVEEKIQCFLKAEESDPKERLRHPTYYRVVAKILWLGFFWNPLNEK